MSRTYNQSETDDIIFISRKDFEQNSQSNQSSQRRYPFVYLDMNCLNSYINMPGKSIFNISKEQDYERMNMSVINFNQLDDLDSEQSSQDSPQSQSQTGQILVDTNQNNQFNDNLINTEHDAFQNKSISSSMTEICQSSNIKSQTSTKIPNKYYKSKVTDILNNKNLDPYTLLKKKYLSKKIVRQQILEQDQDFDQSVLTYYQRKKNFIQKMKEEDMLLDWDSIKRDEKLYESIHIGGASRKRHIKKNEQAIIQKNVTTSQIPPQSQPQQQAAISASQVQPSVQTQTNLYQKEAKSYRKVPRSSRYQPTSADYQVEDEKTSTMTIEQDLKERALEKREENLFDGIQIEMELVEVSEEELLKRKEEFNHSQFLRGITMIKSHNYVSSKAQATIPQIRPIEDVRNSWVLKDIDSILTYKSSPEFDSLEIYMNKFFDKRTPEQIFSILKQNKYNLKSAIDYCNFNSDYLKNYFAQKDQEQKKKQQKRKSEKKYNNS